MFAQSPARPSAKPPEFGGGTELTWRHQALTDGRVVATPTHHWRHAPSQGGLWIRTIGTPACRSAPPPSRRPAVSPPPTEESVSLRERHRRQVCTPLLLAERWVPTDRSVYRTARCNRPASPAARHPFCLVSRFHPRGSKMETKHSLPQDGRRVQPPRRLCAGRLWRKPGCPSARRQHHGARSPPGTRHLHWVSQELEYHIIA